MVLLVLDASLELTDKDLELLELSKNANRIVLLNKTDLPEKLDINQISGDFIRISALKNENLSAVEEKSIKFSLLVKLKPKTQPSYQMLVTFRLLKKL